MVEKDVEYGGDDARLLIIYFVRDWARCDRSRLSRASLGMLGPSWRQLKMETSSLRPPKRSSVVLLITSFPNVQRCWHARSNRSPLLLAAFRGIASKIYIDYSSNSLTIDRHCCWKDGGRGRRCELGGGGDRGRDRRTNGWRGCLWERKNMRHRERRM